MVVAPGAKLRVKVGAESHNVPAVEEQDVSRVTAGPQKQEIIWAMISVTENAFLLKPVLADRKFFMARFLAPKQLPAGSCLRLVFADKVTDVSFNGTPLVVAEAQDGVTVAALTDLLRAENQVAFRVEDGTCIPFVWLTGDFLVKSLTPYAQAANSTIRTEGLLTVMPLTALSAKGELVQAGLPFAHKPVVAEMKLSCPVPTTKLKFEFSAAQPDAIRVEDESGILGWVWGPGWTLDLPQPLVAGIHRLRIQCVPNSYNY